MMWVLYVFIAIIFMITGVNYFEGMVKTRELEAAIDSTISLDWQNGIPFDGIVDANKICLVHPNLKGCDTLHNQIIDISISFKSCLDDERSRLCQYFVDVVSKHSIFTILPNTEAQRLPSTPFYLNMPTHGLEALSSKFGYRTEAKVWWWDSWHLLLLSGVGMLMVTIFLLAWWMHHNKVNQHRVLELAIQREADDVQVKMQLKHDYDARKIEIDRARVLAEATEDKRIKLAAKQLADELVVQAAAKLAVDNAEQAEAAALLNAIFKNTPKSKRR